MNYYSDDVSLQRDLALFAANNFETVAHARYHRITRHLVMQCMSRAMKSGDVHRWYAMNESRPCYARHPSINSTMEERDSLAETEAAAETDRRIPVMLRRPNRRRAHGSASQ